MPFEDRTTNLDLNGPNIKIKTDAFGHEEGSTTSKTTVNPFGADASRTGGTLEITGVGTASWPTGFSTYASNTGTIGYQWYKLNIAGVGEPLGISTRYEGQTTDTLKLKYLDNPADNQKQYYVETRILPSAYAQPEGATVTAGTARSTGFAINETIDSSRVTVTVFPELTLNTQPTNQSATINNNAEFNTSATVTDNSTISYQWYVDGNEVSDGDLTSTNFASVRKEKYAEGESNGRDNSITIPEDATNVVIRVGAGAGGYGGTDTNGQGGAGGYGRVGYFSLPDGGRTLTIRTGQRGENAQSGGSAGGGGGQVTGDGDGGNGGTGGNSGTGGGGASGCYVYDGLTSTWIISAGGGGGGGGGSWNVGGNAGNNGGDWQAISGDVARTSDSTGKTGAERGGGQGSDGGAGGGGGGGYRGGNGGSSGIDNPPPPPDPPRYGGCTDRSAKNYESWADYNDGSCIYPTRGCTNRWAPNFDSTAEVDDGSCEKNRGCTDLRANNFSILAVIDDGSCTYPPEPDPPRRGCTDLRANNFSILAVEDDGSCTYDPPRRGCTDGNANNYDARAEEDDGSCTYPAAPDDDDDDEDGCFVGATRVVMRSPTIILSDSSTEETKPISEVIVGDYVMNKDKTEANKVVFVEKRSASDKELYAPKSDEKPFATKNHMLYVDGKWVHADGDQYPWLEECELVSNVVVEPGGEQVLYNLWVTGDGSYIVNGYGTHSIMFDGGFMKNAHDQGLLGYDDVLLLMEEFTEQKSDLLYGSFLVNRLLGKVNVKLLNRLWVNILCAEDSTKRKKAAHLVMKILQKIRRIV